MATAKNKTKLYKVGDYIELSKGQLALIKFVGTTEFSNEEIMYGIEYIDGTIGKHNGTVRNKFYFEGMTDRCCFVKNIKIRKKLTKLQRSKAIERQKQHGNNGISNISGATMVINRRISDPHSNVVSRANSRSASPLPDLESLVNSSELGPTSIHDSKVNSFDNLDINKSPRNHMRSVSQPWSDNNNHNNNNNNFHNNNNNKTSHGFEANISKPKRSHKDRSHLFDKNNKSRKEEKCDNLSKEDRQRLMDKAEKGKLKSKSKSTKNVKNDKLEHKRQKSRPIVFGDPFAERTNHLLSKTDYVRKRDSLDKYHQRVNSRSNVLGNMDNIFKDNGMSRSRSNSNLGIIDDSSNNSNQKTHSRTSSKNFSSKSGKQAHGNVASRLKRAQTMDSHSLIAMKKAKSKSEANDKREEKEQEAEKSNENEKRNGQEDESKTMETRMKMRNSTSNSSSGSKNNHLVTPNVLEIGESNNTYTSMDSSNDEISSMISIDSLNDDMDDAFAMNGNEDVKAETEIDNNDNLLSQNKSRPECVVKTIKTLANFDSIDNIDSVVNVKSEKEKENEKQNEKIVENEYDSDSDGSIIIKADIEMDSQNDSQNVGINGNSNNNGVKTKANKDTPDSAGDFEDPPTLDAIDSDFEVDFGPIRSMSVRSAVSCASSTTSYDSPMISSFMWNDDDDDNDSNKKKSSKTPKVGSKKNKNKKSKKSKKRGVKAVKPIQKIVPNFSNGLLSPNSRLLNNARLTQSPSVKLQNLEVGLNTSNGKIESSGYHRRNGSRKFYSHNILMGNIYQLVDGRVGICMYNDIVKFSHGHWIGMELVMANGNTDLNGDHNGTVDGHTYFVCRDNRGVFVKSNQICRCLGKYVESTPKSGKETAQLYDLLSTQY